MPELLGEALGAVGEKLTDRLDLVELHPAYRARFADGSTIDVHTDAEAMEDEVRRVCGPRRRPAIGACAVADRALPGRDRRLHRAELRLPARPARARPFPAGRARRLRPARAAGGAAAARRAPAADLLLPVPLRGRAAAPGARGVRGDRVHGHRRGRLLPARRHAPGRAGARGRRGRRRGAARLRAHRDRAGARRRARPRRAPPGDRGPRRRDRAAAVRRRRAHSGPPGGARAARAAPRRPVRLRYAPSAVVLHLGVAPARTGPTRRTTRSPSGRPGAARSGRSSTRAG